MAACKQKKANLITWVERRIVFFPKQVYLWGSILEKNRLGTLLWARIWPWAGLGVGFGSVGRAGWVGRGVGRAGRAGWVGRGVGVLGVLGCVGFGRAGRAGWVGRGVGRGGRASWVGRGVGRGVWPCWARWQGWAWFQSTSVNSGNTKVDFQSTKVYAGNTKLHFQITQSILSK